VGDAKSSLGDALSVTHTPLVVPRCRPVRRASVHRVDARVWNGRQRVVRAHDSPQKGVPAEAVVSLTPRVGRAVMRRTGPMREAGEHGPAALSCTCRVAEL
jgi:hypothetical protein